MEKQIKTNDMTLNKSQLIELKLKTLKEFQEKYPKSHIGGSIGLMLLGIDLQRDITISDLDITIDDYINNIPIEFEQRSDSNDFDYAFKIEYEDGYYTKLDIRVCPEPSFVVVNYNGIKYNVSLLSNILFWKQKYANKGVKKHEDDLITIKTGIRPINKIEYDDFLW